MTISGLVSAQQCGDYDVAARNLSEKYGESRALSMVAVDRAGNPAIFEIWLASSSTWTIVIRRQVLSAGVIRDCASIYASGDQWDGDIDLPEPARIGA